MTNEKMRRAIELFEFKWTRGREAAKKMNRPDWSSDVFDTAIEEAAAKFGVDAFELECAVNDRDAEADDFRKWE